MTLFLEGQAEAVLSGFPQSAEAVFPLPDAGSLGVLPCTAWASFPARPPSHVHRRLCVTCADSEVSRRESPFLSFSSVASLSDLACRLPSGVVFRAVSEHTPFLFADPPLHMLHLVGGGGGHRG